MGYLYGIHRSTNMELLVQNYLSIHAAIAYFILFKPSLSAVLQI